ncbi:MAG: tetratricopeptide repeat protein [Pirellulales bacterium]
MRWRQRTPQIPRQEGGTSLAFPTASLAAWLALIAASPGSADESAAPKNSPAVTADAVGSSEFEDRVTPLVPRRPRSERDLDRVTASVQFAHGRLLLQRDDEVGALRRFQRAWHYDPTSVSPLRDIVTLAAQLRRNEEAVRYAVLVERPQTGDLPLLLRLAAFASERRDWSSAARLYEKIAALLAAAPPEFTTVMVQLELGRLHFLLDHSAEAARAFAQVRDALADPDRFGLSEQLRELLLEQPDRTYLLFGESFLQARRFDEALAMYRRADQLKPRPALLAYQTARVAAERDDAAAAQRALSPLLDQDLGDLAGDVYQLWADVTRKLHTDPRAGQQAVVERLVELDRQRPTDRQLNRVLARQWASAGRWEEAAASFHKLTRPTIQDGEPADDDLPDDLAGQRDALRQLQRWDELCDLLVAAAQRLPLGDLAELVSPLGQQAPTTAAVLDRVAPRLQGSDEGAMPAALAGGLLAIAAKRYDQADQCLARAEQAATAEQRAEILQSWALRMFAAGEADRAARVLRRAIDERVRPEADAVWNYFLAGALTMQEDTTAALEAATRAVALGGGNPQYEVRVAWIAYHAGRYQEAERDFRRLVRRLDQLDPTPAVRAAARESRLILSNIAVRTARVAEAVEWLEQVLDEFPEDVAAQNDLGYLWADAGIHLERALSLCQRAVAAQPDNRSYRDSLGWALFRLQRWDEAEAELTRAAAGDEVDGVILDHLGDVQQQLGKTEAARDSWQRAVTAFERDKDEERRAATHQKLNSPR